MWVDFMRPALKGTPEMPLEEPPSLVSVRIDAKTGLPTSADNKNAIFEFFRANHVPKRNNSANANTPAQNSNTSENITEQLF